MSYSVFTEIRLILHNIRQIVERFALPFQFIWCREAFFQKKKNYSQWHRFVIIRISEISSFEHSNNRRTCKLHLCEKFALRWNPMMTHTLPECLSLNSSHSLFVLHKWFNSNDVKNLSLSLSPIQFEDNEIEIAFELIASQSTWNEFTNPFSIYCFDDADNSTQYTCH